MFDIIKEKSTSLGAVWKDDITVKEVFVDLDKKTGRPFMVGIRLENGEFVPANAIHLTLGYKAKFVYEGSTISPIKSDYTVGTAASFIFVIKKTKEVREVFAKYNRMFDASIYNIHYTMLFDGEDHFLLRSTSGGHTGN